jgi:hypothetical protein
VQGAFPALSRDSDGNAKDLKIHFGQQSRRAALHSEKMRRAELEVEAELVDYATGRMLFGLVTTFPADTEAGRVLILP